MKILLCPQFRKKDFVRYKITEGVITATINGLTDTFDFRDFPDGELEVWSEKGEYLIQSSIEDILIDGARKINGELHVEILYTVDFDEKDERLLFPEWLTLEEFNDLMKEIEERDRKKQVKENG